MKKSVICFIAIATHIAFVQGDTTGVPPGVIRQDIKLSLTVPEYPLLNGEYPVPYMLRITNNGNIPLPLCLREVVGTQLKFDFGKPGYRKGWDSPDVSITRSWGDVSITADGTVAPGESYDLDLTEWFYPVQEACCFVGTTNITAYLLVGENEWAKSEPTHIQVKRDNTYERIKTPIFTARKVDRDLGKRDLMSFFLYIIDGQKWLFTSRTERVCELPNDAPPEFQFDENTEVLTISRPNKKPVRYNLKKRKVEPEEN